MLTTQKKIQHLYLRAGFGIAISELKGKDEISIQEVVQELFKASEQIIYLDGKLSDIVDSKALSRVQKAVFRKRNKTESINLNAIWVTQMANSKNPLLERMTLFWHGHFACVTKNNPHLSQNQNNTIRKYALGNFKDLVLAISKDPGMIRYLNNQQNKKGKPNENFARELLELFTIGQGNYTEKDIKEAARAFTGWQSNFKMEFSFNKRHHDFGSKDFFGETGNFNGEDIIDLVLKQKQTARFISTKIYQYFVNEKLDKTHIEELTNVFYDSNYNIETLMQTLFKSDWFYDSKNIGTKIKSPIDLLVGAMKTLKIKFENKKSIFFIEKILGQILFNPPNVAGWAGGQAWIDNATLILRLNLVNYLFQATDLEITEKPEFEAFRNQATIKKLEADFNIKSIVNQLKNKDNSIIFEYLKNGLIQPNLKLTKTDFEAFTIQNNSTNYIQSLMMRLMTLPEYQMC
jgi:uncharacterized protein (DUF1800 family)